MADSSSQEPDAEQYLRGRMPATRQEADRAERALASALEKLSVHQREEILWDIHGVNKSNDPDEPNANREPLQQLEKELSVLIDQKKAAAYERAWQLDGRYVGDEAFRLLFLRAEEMDPKKAAVRLAAHFEIKQELFAEQAGIDVLVRDVTWNDLTPEDHAIAEAGVWQVSPQPDVAGRTVIFTTSTFVLPHFEANPMSRVLWYTFMSSLHLSEHKHTKGIVNVAIHLPAGTVMPSFALRQFGRVRSCLPIITTAIHHCYDNPALYLAILGLRLIMFAFNTRHSLVYRLHYGTWAQIEPALQSFGIPTEENPCCARLRNSQNNLQTNILSWHHKWLQQVREFEEKRRKTQSEVPKSSTEEEQHGSGDDPLSPAPDSAKEKSSMCIVPRDSDVLLGRTKQACDHPGTVRCHELVGQHQANYEKASRRDKTQVAQHILELIKSSQGRFLRWEETAYLDGGYGAWVVVDDKTARDKISHTFRNLRLEGSRKKPAQVESSWGARKNPLSSLAVEPLRKQPRTNEWGRFP